MPIALSHGSATQMTNRNIMNIELSSTFYVIVRVDDQEIVASATDLDQAEAERLAAEKESGEDHQVLLATQELAESFTDWAWQTTTIVRDGTEIEMAIIDR